MALVLCAECGRQVSNKAISCPGCGYPVAVTRVSSEVRLISCAAKGKVKRLVKKTVSHVKYGSSLFIGCMELLLLLVLFVLALAAALVPMVTIFNPVSDMDLLIGIPLVIGFFIGFGFVAKSLLVSLITAATNIILVLKRR